VLGQSVSLLGSMVTAVALPVQMYALTHSTVAVGLVGAAEFAPILGLALVGGALADAFDRRRLIQLSEAGALLVALGLVANALLPHPSTAALYVAAALSAGFYALMRPPMDSLLPRLVERDELATASVLYGAVRNLAQLGGPALGGGLLALAGAPVAYGLDAATFAVSLTALAAMRTPPPPPDAAPPSLRGVVEGARFAASRQELVGTYLVDMNAMFFAMPEALFPAVAARHGGPEVAGLLFAAPAAGALGLSLVSGWTRHVRRHGRAVVLAAVGWGLAGLAVAGAMDEISGVFRATIWNETIPDRLRGRLAGVEMLSWSSGPTLGNVEAGFAAALVGLRTSIVAGGLLCVAGSLALAVSLPSFWRYESDARLPADGAPR
jgi:MFS family permease